ncbi:MAG: Gp138 family membrane-puncturing spike protein [Novosphingobium sp.]
MTEEVTGFASLDSRLDDYSLMRFMIQQELTGVATSTVVEVKAVHDGLVDVQPLVNQIDGAGTGIPHGIIHDLPVHAMRAGPCVIRINPRVGDIGHVVFCHNDISTVKKTGARANPSSRRRFDWSDGIYYGGILPQSDPTTVIEIDADDNVAITAPTMNVTVTDKVAVTGPVDSDTEYRVGGVKVLGERQGAISDPSGGSNIDSEARAALSALLAIARSHGLIEA